MARGNKNYDKEVRKVNKGQSAEKKIKTLHKMVESLIKGESDEAEEALHEYLTMKSRTLIIGEAEECEDDKEEMEADEKEDKDEDDEDEDDDKEEEVEEGFAQPDEGVMKKAVHPQTKVSGGAKAKKHGNAAAHLDDNVKGEVKHDRFPGKGKMKKHSNVKDDFAKGTEGRDKNLGTTE